MAERKRTLPGTHDLDVPVAELEELARAGHVGALEALKAPSKARKATKATKAPAGRGKPAGDDTATDPGPEGAG